jgi:hypothetical protein
MKSDFPAFPTDPKRDQKFYNFKWSGMVWVNLSTKRSLIISEDEPALPCDDEFWYNPSEMRMHRQAKEVWDIKNPNLTETVKEWFAARTNWWQ